MPNEDLPIAIRPPSSLLAQGADAQRIVAEMVSDAIALAGAPALASQKRFKIGEIELCEPDYRQCLHWASSLKLTPEDFLERLLKPPVTPFLKSHPTLIEDGQLRRIFWDGRLLPMERFGLVAELQTQSLFCVEGFSQVDLSLVPNLTELNCSFTRITELDLSPVPKLATLWCSSTGITELDLSPVLNLTKLSCSETEITELDISTLPRLQSLTYDQSITRVIQRSDQNF